MSLKSAHAYIQRLLTDSAFLERISKLPESKRASLHRKEGFDFTVDELRAAKHQIRQTTVGDLMRTGRSDMKSRTARTAVSVGADVVARALYFDGTDFEVATTKGVVGLLPRARKPSR
jgi:predicted ribosomally synthesized peptide with nif11-like leader